MISRNTRDGHSETQVNQIPAGPLSCSEGVSRRNDTGDATGSTRGQLMRKIIEGVRSFQEHKFKENQDLFLV
ncbi:MAG: hypothetical protein ACXVCF_07505, partial [Isosphaeraceae bacterium]